MYGLCTHCSNTSYNFDLGIITDENQSLFTYHREQSWFDFYHPDFVPAFEPVFSDPKLEGEAMLACKNDTFCLYDIAATGRMDIGLSTLDGSKEFEEMQRLSYPGGVNIMYHVLHSYTHYIP